MLDHIGKHMITLNLNPKEAQFENCAILLYFITSYTLFVYTESVKRSSLWTGSDDEYSDEDDSLSNTSSYKRISQGTVIRKTPASEYSTSVLPR